MRLLRSLRVSAFVLCLAIFVGASTAFAEAWSIHQSRLPFYSKQVEGLERDIKNLIEQKNKTHDPQQVARIMNEIAAKNTQLEKVFKDYQEERNHVRFNHPDRAAQVERLYQRVDVKSLEELEGEMGLDGHLDRVKARMLAIFPIPESKEKKDETPKVFQLRKPASLDPDDIDAPEKIRLVK